MTSASIKDQTISSTKWNGIERITVNGIQFLLTLVLARLLMPTDYGIIGMLAIFIEISQTFIDSGFQAALVRKTDVNDKDFSTAFYFNVFVAVIIYFVLFCCAPAIASFFNQPILSSVLRIYSVSLFINSLMVVQVSMLQIRLDFKSLAKRNISATIISGVIGIILAYSGFGVWALVWQNIAASLINLIFICYVCRWIPRSPFSKQSFKYLWFFGSRMLGAGLLNTVYKNLTTLAIGKFYSADDLGYYSRGSQFAHVPTNTVNGVLNTITYPILAKIQDDETRLMGVYRKYIRMSSLVIFIMCGILAALGKPLILFFLTEKWSSAIIFLQLFALGSMFDHMNTINLNLLKVKGKSDLFFRLEVVKKTIALIILGISIPLGVLSICISKLIYNQIAIIINTYYTGKLFHLGYLQQMKDISPFLWRTIVSCFPAYALTFFDLPYIVTIIVGAIISLFLYWLMLRKNPDMIELIDLIKEKKAKKGHV